MRLGPEDFRRYYASLSDEALLALDRSELVETARECHDQELARRGLDLSDSAADDALLDDEDAGAGIAGGWDADEELSSDRLGDAVCACAFGPDPGGGHSHSEAGHAREVLRAAGIPCSVLVNELEPQHPGAPPRYEYCVMVPGTLMLHAVSVLDRDIFNLKQEADWRTHFENLSDEELCGLDPGIFCAGLLDRAARLRRAYTEELNRRALARE